MLIKNGTLIDPKTKTSKKTDIYIEEGIIQKIAPELSTAAEYANKTVIDAEGLIIAPGLIDTHIHFRDPGFTYKEDLHTGSLAAAKGGVTSVICMANTSPSVDSVSVLEDILARSKKEDIRIFQAAAISHSLKGDEMTDMHELKEAGACGFTDDGIPLKNAAFCFEAMQKAAELDMPVSLHEEDTSFIQNNFINN